MKFGISGCLYIFDRVSVANAEFTKFVIQDRQVSVSSGRDNFGYINVNFNDASIAQPQRWLRYRKLSCGGGGGVFLEKEILVFQCEQSRKFNCVKVAIKNF